MRGSLIAAAALTVAALAGCGRGADSGATSNGNAPGSPGTGNAATVVAPQQNDSMAGGSSGAKGSAPHPGSSGGDTVMGASGRGTDEPGGRSQTAQPGIGTAGGLGGTAGLGMTGSFPAGGSASSAQTVPQGSSNRSTEGAVGQR